MAKCKFRVEEENERDDVFYACIMKMEKVWREGEGRQELNTKSERIPM